MMPNEIQRLAHATNDLRPDWPISSLRTFIENNLSKRAYRDAAVALVWVAVDVKPDGSPASATPKRVLEAGPWWQAASAHDGKVRGNYPPKRDEQCSRHPGQFATNCGGCATDKLADDEVRATPVERPRPGDAVAGAALARKLMGRQA